VGLARSADAAAHAQELAEKSDNIAQLFLQKFGSFSTVVTRGDLLAANPFADQMLDLAVREGSPVTLGLAHASQVEICYFRGDLTGAEKHFIAGAAMFEASARKFPSALGSGFGYGSHVAWMLGYADAASDRIRQAIAGATNLKSPFELAHAQFLAAALQLFLKEFADAKTAAAAAVALSDEYGFQHYAAASRIFLGLADTSLGGLNDGIALARLGLDGIVKSEAHVARTLYLSWIAVAEALNGAISDALTTIERALEANPAELAWRPDALRIRGEFRLKLHQTDEAEGDFRDAIALARQIGAKAWELRSSMSLVRMLRKRGNIAEARDLLAPLYSSFTEGFDTADLKNAKVLFWTN
jgi:tetratricopeptide (TPR) repeat protein